MDKEIIDRIYFLIKNMHGYDLEWEWMSEAKPQGEYLRRDEVLKVLDEVAKETS